MTVDINKLMNKLELGKQIPLGCRFLEGSNEVKFKQLTATSHVLFAIANSGDFIAWLFEQYECDDVFYGILLDEYAFYIGGNKWLLVKEIATTEWSSEHVFEVVGEEEYYKFREEREE